MAKWSGVRFSGLDSFKQELQVLTSDLVEEANAIMLQAAFDAADQIRGAYPIDSGELRAGVMVVPHRGTLLSGGEVKNIAHHAHLYERGTRVRENAHGDNRGAVLPHPTFIPIADTFQRAAVQNVIARLYQHGASNVTVDESA